MALVTTTDTFRGTHTEIRRLPLIDVDPLKMKQNISRSRFWLGSYLWMSLYSEMSRTLLASDYASDVGNTDREVAQT